MVRASQSGVACCQAFTIVDANSSSLLLGYFSAATPLFEPSTSALALCDQNILALIITEGKQISFLLPGMGSSS